MRVVLGIGNPGSRYKNHRHNVGFQFLNYYARTKLLKFKSSKHDYHVAEGEILDKPFALIKPDTYVNLSGLAAAQCINSFNVNIEDLLVIVDDINIALADFRVRNSGGSGGHNGLNSIISMLNSDMFPRLRIGIGNAFESGKMPDYVLSDFTPDDFDKLKKSFDLGIQMIDSFIIDGYNSLLSCYSRIKNLEINNKDPK